MDTVLFVGPSLRPADLESVDNRLVQVRPPVRRGDLGAAMADGFTTIAIVDGEFYQRLAVSPKEILACLYAGATIAGGASMGALRAAELHPYGMVGVGRIYDWYRSGRVTRDDDVAVTFGEVDGDYAVFNVPMVNVMWVMAACKATGELDASTRRRISLAARRIPWTQRSWPAVCRTAGIGDDATAIVMRYARDPGYDLKRLDALATIQWLYDEAHSTRHPTTTSRFEGAKWNSSPGRSTAPTERTG